MKRDGSDIVESECFRRREDLLATVSNDTYLDIGVTGEGSSDVGER